MGDGPKKSTAKTWGLVTMALSEVLGTGLLVLFGCMGGLPSITGQAPPAFQSALVFGITVSTIIQIFGHVSGAHLNPAVTIAAWILNFTPHLNAVIFILSQFVGATLGYAALVMVTPEAAFHPTGQYAANITHNFCATAPGENISVTQALLGEYFATCMLILLCCGIWDRRNEAKQDGVPLKFGLAIAGLAMAEGPYSGCSMNPARSFGPALVTGYWSSHWIYWIGPIVAAITMAYLYQYIFDRDLVQASVPVPDEEEEEENVRLNHNKTVESKASQESLPNV